MMQPGGLPASLKAMITEDYGALLNLNKYGVSLRHKTSAQACALNYHKGQFRAEHY